MIMIIVLLTSSNSSHSNSCNDCNNSNSNSNNDNTNDCSRQVPASGGRDTGATQPDPISIMIFIMHCNIVTTTVNFQTNNL